MLRDKKSTLTQRHSHKGKWKYETYIIEFKFVKMAADSLTVTDRQSATMEIKIYNLCREDD